MYLGAGYLFYGAIKLKTEDIIELEFPSVDID